MSDADHLQTIPEVVRFWGRERPDAEVFIFLDKLGRYCVCTPREVSTLASRFAGLLRHSYGFLPGDVIANGLPNCPERVIADMGIIMAGCVMVNCQVLEKDGSDLWNTARVARCKGVILPVTETSAPYCLFQPLLSRPPAPTTSHVTSEGPQNLEREGSPPPPSPLLAGFATVSTPHATELTRAILVNRSPVVQGEILIQDSFLDRLRALEDDNINSTAADDSPAVAEVVVAPGDIAVLFATSGSSGFCKLVPRTHQSILDAARSFHGGKDGKYFSDRPFGWMGGFPFDYLAFCAVRALQDQFDGGHATSGRELWSVIAREKCTGAAMVPMALEELVREFQSEIEKPDYIIPAIVTSGQPLRESLGSSLGLFTRALVVAYSSTEVGMVCASLVTSPDQMKDFFAGRPLPGVQLKVVDEEGNEVGYGISGHVLVKSTRSLKQYYNQPEESKGLYTADGWLKTGDQGSIDQDGNFYCLGRAGDAVLQGSVVVYTSWPEGILAKCPDVAQVAVVIVPLGPADRPLCACVVPKPGSGLTEEGLMRFYKDSFFGSAVLGSAPPISASVPTSPSYEARPRGYVIELKKILFLNDIPKTQTGKVNKKELVALATQAMID